MCEMVFFFVPLLVPSVDQSFGLNQLELKKIRKVLGKVEKLQVQSVGEADCEYKTQ